MAEDKSRKYMALAVVIGLGVFILYALRLYVTAFFAAFILFVLFRPLFNCCKIRMNRKLAATIILLLSMLVIIIPGSLILTLAYSEVRELMTYRTTVIEQFKSFDERFPQLDLAGRARQQLSGVEQWLTGMFIQTLQGFGRAVIFLTIMYFVLYYLLVNNDTVEAGIARLIPFSKKNSQALIEEFKDVTYVTIYAQGLISVFQGAFLTIGLLIFGIPGAFFWGLAGAVLSFLPVVGISFIWIPAGAIYILQQDYYVGIGILVWGAVLSNVDNLIRPALQERLGKMHPLTSLIGIFIGLPFFGLLGIVVGPLLLSYFLLSAKMFKEEYM